MSDKVYRKVGHRYEPLGVEFNGFPADGVWLVLDGRHNCIVPLMDRDDIPKVPVLPYKVLVHEFFNVRWPVLSNKPHSAEDLANSLAEFFAERAAEAKQRKGAGDVC